MTKPKRKKKNKSKPGLQNRRDIENGYLECQDGLEKLPYAVNVSPTIGRFLEAAKDLAAGEILLEEDALVVGPTQDGQALCIGCYIPLDFTQSVRCGSCGYPLCSSDCTGKSKKTGHSSLECAYLAKTPVKSMPMPDLQRTLEAIMPLRCLILREADPASWAIVYGMEAHTEQRRHVSSLWDGNQKNVVDVIRGQWGLPEFEEDVIHHVCGVLEVNAFEVSTSLRAIYPTAYLFAHNCIPNTRHSDGPEFKISFRTTIPIRKSGVLYVTYTYVLQGTMKRRKHLRDTKFFECGCERCRDFTECGTNISALKCPVCLYGMVQSAEPMDPTANWTCRSSQCSGYVVEANTVMAITERIFNELDNIEGNNIPGYEAFILKHSKVLNDNHYLCLSALHCLFQLYGKIDGYLINNLTDQQLQRKIYICRVLLEAFNKLDPGLSKQRGLILYELHAPMLILMQRRFQEKKCGKLELKRDLREVLNCLEEAKKILGVEPAGSQEAEMGVAAEEALDRLVTWRTLINKI